MVCSAEGTVKPTRRSLGRRSGRFSKPSIQRDKPQRFSPTISQLDSLSEYYRGSCTPQRDSDASDNMSSSPSASRSSQSPSERARVAASVRKSLKHTHGQITNLPTPTGESQLQLPGPRGWEPSESQVPASAYVHGVVPNPDTQFSAEPETEPDEEVDLASDSDASYEPDDDDDSGSETSSHGDSAGEDKREEDVQAAAGAFLRLITDAFNVANPALQTTVSYASKAKLLKRVANRI